MYAANIAKAGIVMGNVTDVGHMEQWVNNKIIQEKSLALAEAISEIKITNLQTQVASLTSAVAETAQGECDKMLRLRNLDKVLTIKTNNNGSFEDKKANKTSRETELKNWLEALFSSGLLRAVRFWLNYVKAKFWLVATPAKESRKPTFQLFFP